MELWNERAASAIRATRPAIKCLLEEGGIRPEAAEEFLYEAITSIPPNQWVECSDPASLLIQAVKTKLRSGASKKRQRGAG